MTKVKILSQHLNMGDKFKPSKDYGVSVIFKGRKLGADVDISGIFTMKFVNKVINK